MKIFLTGATGFIGGHVLRRLVQDGHIVTCAIRSLGDALAIEALGAKVWLGDFHDLDRLRPELSSCQAIIHCAAYLKLGSPNIFFERHNVELTRQLIIASQVAGVSQFIYLSAASVVMQEPQAMYDCQEDLPVTNLAILPYSRSKALAEQIVLNGTTFNMKTIVLRPAFVWGLGDAVDTQIGPAVASKRFGWFEEGDYLYATCYIGNLCLGILLALDSQVTREVFFIADAKPVHFRTWMTQRLQASGFHIPSMSFSQRNAWSLAKFTENGWRYLPLPGNPPLVREMVRMMGYPFTVSCQKLRSVCGYEATFSQEQGFEELQK